MSDDWTKDYFTDEYLLKYEQRLMKNTQHEAEFIIDALGLRVGDSVLDIACGYGRHVVALLEQLRNTYGVDSCTAYIDKAKNDNPQYADHFFVGDMRNIILPKITPIYHAFNFFTSFGYYSDEENNTVIANISSVLFKGGLFLMHVRNREWMMRNFVRNQWDSYDNHTELTIREFDLETSSMRTNLQYWPSGRHVQQRVRFYTLAELIGMMKFNGLRFVKAYGGIDGRPYTIDSEWMIIVAERV
jgi:SAM-dependent methyltransferase